MSSPPKTFRPFNCVPQVVATDADGPDFGALRYSLSDGFDWKDLHPPLFHINADTGEVCVSQDIDRDTGQTSHDILVKAVDQGGLSAQTYVHVEVEDVNDHAPVFNPQRYAGSVSSHAPPDTEVLTAVATDPDSGRYGRLSMGARDGGGRPAATPARLTVNVLASAQTPAVFSRSRYSFTVSEDAPPGTSVGAVTAVQPGSSLGPVTYSISSGDPQGSFSVHPDTGLIGTRRPLDHESQPYALLVLQSSSTGSSSSSSSSSSPVLRRAMQSRCPGTRRRGTVIFIAHAHDTDSGDNGRVRYHLADSQTGDDKPPFVVDPDLGTVTLNASLRSSGQRGKTKMYVLEIVARDKGRPPLSALLTLEVNVDHMAPGGGEEEEEEGEEDALAFETLVYQVEIGEGYRRDARVIQVKAHLGGGQRRGGVRGASNAISYSLEPEPGFPAPPFRVHAKSGWLYLYQSLDYETEPGYQFRVVATATRDPVLGSNNNKNSSSGSGGSSSSSQRTARASVRVLVLDANDNAPVFAMEAYYFSVPEGSSPQGLVGTVRAVDRDARENAQLSYMLLSDGKYFGINPKTGEIMNWVALDREQHSQHSLKVMVSDHGQPRLNGTATVHVSMWAGLPTGSLVTTMFAKDPDAGENGTVTFSLRTDDGLGVFEIDAQSGDIILKAASLQPIETHYTLEVHGGEAEFADAHRPIVRHFTVREDAPPATAVGSVAITDGGARFRYSIAEGDGNVHFGVDPASGDLYVTQPLDYESATQYFLVVRADAQQADAPPLNASVWVSVSVEDINDHAPWFPDDLVVLGLQEDIAVGMRTADRRRRPFPFALDPYTGRLTVGAPLDREAEPSFAFTVTAFDRPAAGDQGDMGRQASVTAQVFLLDVNDNRPVLMSPDAVRVVEDAEVGTLLHHVVALDRDLGENGRISYSLVAGDDQGVFRLEQNTVYQLEIGNFTLTVTVEDANDWPPVFQRAAYEASVAENRSPGEPVVRLSATDGDSGKNAEVQYSLLPGPGYDLFSIHPQTGQVSTTTQLDREQQQQFTLRVLSRDGGSPALSSTTTVVCTVLDENDNPPRFMQTSFHVSLPENLPPGVLHAGQASDPDLGENSTIHYSLDSQDDHGGRFAIDGLTGAVSSTEVLDREERGVYTLTIRATDGGPHPLSATARLHVRLLDENDNSPSFSRSDYQASLAEGLPAGTEVLRLRASDPDLGANGEVTYSLEGDDNGSQGAFEVDAATGAVRTTRPLDREARARYTLRALVTDGCAAGPRSSEAAVTVRVEDVNDNAPACARDPVSAWVAAATTRTWRHNRAAIATVTATDLDQGENGTVRYMWAEGEEPGAAVGAGLFALNATSGEIRLRRPLRAGFPGRMLRVLVADQGRPALTSTCLVFIHLKGDPDALLFTQKVYNATVPENSTAGEITVHRPEALDFEERRHAQLVVSASDADLGSAVSYSLVAVDGGGSGGNSAASHRCFAIDRYSGVITLTGPLDYEDRTEHVLGVAASDSLHRTTGEVVVTVLDVNDNAPVFEQVSYQVSDEAPAHALIATLSATDADSGLNGKVSYRLLSPPSLGFSIHPDNGSVFTNKPLKEITSNNLVQLLVEARDGGDPVRSTITSLDVVLLDTNDNAPVFQQDTYTVSVPEDTLPGTTLLTLSAEDADWAPENTQLDYGIVKGNEKRRFFLELSAHDPDRGVNGLVHYEIISGNGKGHLLLDPNSGVLSVNGSLDYEEDSKYTLTIRASDGGISEDRKVAFAVVFVTVLDENDNTPYFMFPLVNCSVLENLPAFSPVCSVFAMDNDLGTYGQLTYSVLSSCFTDYGSGSRDRKEAFAIDSLTGDIHTRQTLDYELERVLCLVVEARDKGGKAATLRVLVAIRGVDEFSPVFTQRQYNFRLPEDAKPGQTVGYVMAMDNDGGVDGMVEYSFTDPSPFFSIDKTIGGIFVTGPVYRQISGPSIEDTVQIIIAAASPRPDSRRSTCLVSINISNSAVALVGAPLDVHTASLTVSLLTFLLFLTIFMGLVLSMGLSTALASAESLHHFKEEGGGEGLLPTAIRVRDLEESFRIRGHIPLSEAHAPPSSLSSLVCPEDQLHSSYGSDYLLDWEPRFQPLASVFADIGMLSDEDLQGGVEDLAATEASCLMYPPPLITGVAQPGVRAVPPRMPGRGGRPSYPRYSYTPLARNTGLTPCAMTPSFSPSLSLLTMRTPNASPVVSEAGVGGLRLHSGPHPASLLDSEVQARHGGVPLKLNVNCSARASEQPSEWLGCV
ncbi:hypothetical protein CRUP_022298 [Coryphaenoides rupestris]|nr:hypothetical protein CRUP_022298 [Coryphaenoides rupestris]